MLEMDRNGCKWKYIRRIRGGQDPPKLVEKHSSNKICGENSDGKITAVKLPFISFQRKGLTPETREETSRQTFHKKFTASHFTKLEFFRWSFWGDPWNNPPFFVAREIRHWLKWWLTPSSPCRNPSLQVTTTVFAVMFVIDIFLGATATLKKGTKNDIQWLMQSTENHRKNTQNDNLWVCFLNFYPLKKSHAKPSTFHPCIQERLFQPSPGEIFQLQACFISKGSYMTSFSAQ